MNVLCTMAEASGSFMQRRVIKDAIPPMTQFLDKQASVSLKAGPVYSQSQAFKLQLAMLRSLGCLCRQLGISEANLSSVVWVCSQYLSCRQPKELQQVCEMLNFLYLNKRSCISELGVLAIGRQQSQFLTLQSLKVMKMKCLFISSPLVQTFK